MRSQVAFPLEILTTAGGASRFVYRHAIYIQIRTNVDRQMLVSLMEARVSHVDVVACGYDA